MSFGFGFGMAKAAAFLSGPVPSLNLQFAGATTLDPRITFTRASSATYFNSSGVLQRATYNLLTYSEQFDNAAWTKVLGSISANAITAPDGALSADAFTPSASAGLPYTQQNATVSSGTTYTWSVYLKSNGYQWVFLDAFDGANNRTYFDLTNGVVGNVAAGNTSTITSVGNGWYRCTLTRSAGATSVAYAVAVATSNGGTSMTGNGTSGIFIWGAQLEQASTAGPYYATTTAANGAPRFDYNPTTLAPRGLLIEEQRTNLLTYSEQFDNAAWSKGNSTITTNAAIAPDGALTADKVVENTANATHDAASSAFTATAGATYTASVYVKAAERSFAWIRLFQNISPFAYVGYTVNLTTGATNSVSFLSTVFTNPAVSVQDVGNGWWRVSVTGTIASADSIRLIVSTATSASTVSYTGDGTSGIYAWGAQLEAGSFATSYIPTVAAQVTRSADSASMTGTNFSSWYRADEGTLYAEFGPYANGGASANLGVFQIDDGSSNNCIRMFNGATVSPVFNVRTGSADQAYLNAGGALSTTSVTKQAGAYKVNDFVRVTNGGAADTDTSGTVPTVNRMLIGGGSGGVTNLNGTIRRIAFYPTRLANATLQALTT